MNEQLIRLGRVSYSATKLQSDLANYLRSNSATPATKLQSDLANYLRSNPATPDETHYSEFINLGAWDTYLRRMASWVTGMPHGGLLTCLKYRWA